jgi:hypothetical protein
VTLNRHFFVLTIGFLALCTFAGALAIALASEHPSSRTTTVAVSSFALAALALWWHAQQDLDAVLTLLAFFLIMTSMCVVIYLIAALEPGIAPKITAAVSGVTGLTLGIVSHRRQRSESADFPNVLAAHFDGRQIYEAEGVQFAGLLEPGGGGEPHWMSVILQNCFDAPRQVRIEFDAGSQAKNIRFHPHHEVTLRAAEVLQVMFPAITPAREGSYKVYFSIGVAGTAGRRVRLWRAQEATKKVGTATTVALLAFGHLHFGGGTYFTLGPLDTELWTSPLPPPSSESLWQPRHGAVPLRD